jgi:hypothetical protein
VEEWNVPLSSSLQSGTLVKQEGAVVQLITEEDRRRAKIKPAELIEAMLWSLEGTVKSAERAGLIGAAFVAGRPPSVKVTNPLIEVLDLLALYLSAAAIKISVRLAQPSPPAAIVHPSPLARHPGPVISKRR